MPQLPELEGRQFAPFIEVKVETKIASAEETEEILRARIERMRKSAAEKETRLSSFSSEKRDLGEMTPNPYVHLRREKITKNKLVETKIDRETFGQVLLRLMEEYGVDRDNFRFRGIPSLEEREYPTKYEYLFFRSISLLDENENLKSVDWAIICAKTPFPSL